MGRKLKAVDAYIGQAAAFAQPVLRHLRTLVHATCPEVEEVIKWGMPHFDYRGPFCHMAAFKQHAAFGFWKRSLVVGQGKTSDEAMGQFGRIGSLADLPSDAVINRYLKKAMQLNEQGIQPVRAPRPARQRLKVPGDLSAALVKNAKARAAFTGFSYSARKEYVEWLTGAKTDETRQRRLATTLEWLAEGKQRNWKYER